MQGMRGKGGGRARMLTRRIPSSGGAVRGINRSASTQRSLELSARIGEWRQSINAFRANGKH